MIAATLLQRAFGSSIGPHELLSAALGLQSVWQAIKQRRREQGFPEGWLSAMSPADLSNARDVIHKLRAIGDLDVSTRRQAMLATLDMVDAHIERRRVESGAGGWTLEQLLAPEIKLSLGQERPDAPQPQPESPVTPQDVWG